VRVQDALHFGERQVAADEVVNVRGVVVRGLVVAGELLLTLGDGLPDDVGLGVPEV